MQQSPTATTITTSASTMLLIRVKDDNTSVTNISNNNNINSGNNTGGLLVHSGDIKKVLYSSSQNVQPACSARGVQPCRLHRSLSISSQSPTITSSPSTINHHHNNTYSSHGGIADTTTIAANTSTSGANDNAACVPVAGQTRVVYQQEIASANGGSRVGGSGTTVQTPVASSTGDANCNNSTHNNSNSGSGGSSGSVQSSKLLGDKYLLLNLVEGSSLYRCLNVHTQQEMVCKIVTRDNSSLLSAHYRLDGVAHMNPLHEVLVGERYLYLVFPKSHGDLHSHVRVRRRLRETEARRLFRQMAETVKICHENGIVLRDLKLRKFVFADPQRSELKLESLEDAVVLENPDDDILHDKRGCPAYVSPEILRAGAHYSGKAADMWSLGVILYTMLVGRYPFNDSEHASLFAKISRGHFVIPECLSSRAKCLIRSLLRREPSERIASEDVLLHPWLVREERDGFVNSTRNSDQQVPDLSFYYDDDE